MITATPTSLTLVAEVGGYRHYLDRQPIHAGEVLDYFDPAQSTWVSARFELIPGHRGRKAVLCIADGQSVPVDSATQLRWSPNG